jgi:hypothetical protein
MNNIFFLFILFIKKNSFNSKEVKKRMKKKPEKRSFLVLLDISLNALQLFAIFRPQ